MLRPADMSQNTSNALVTSELQLGFSIIQIVGSYGYNKGGRGSALTESNSAQTGPPTSQKICQRAGESARASVGY